MFDCNIGRLSVEDSCWITYAQTSVRKGMLRCLTGYANGMMNPPTSRQKAPTRIPSRRHIREQATTPSGGLNQRLFSRQTVAAVITVEILGTPAVMALSAGQRHKRLATSCLINVVPAETIPTRQC